LILIFVSIYFTSSYIILTRLISVSASILSGLIYKSGTIYTKLK